MENIKITVKEYNHSKEVERTLNESIHRVIDDAQDQYSGRLENVGYRLSELVSMNAKLISILVSRDLINKEELSSILGVEVVEIRKK